jgi:hypothetical protein
MIWARSDQTPRRVGEAGDPLGMLPHLDGIGIGNIKERGGQSNGLLAAVAFDLPPFQCVPPEGALRGSYEGSI